MTEPRELFPRSQRPLDVLVRAHLDAAAAATQPEGVLYAVRARLAAAGVRPLRPTLRRNSWARLVPLALAASLFFALFLIPTGADVQASPARVVVEQALTVHSAPTDRLYLVRTELSSRLRPRFGALLADREARLWTRGERFRIEAVSNGRGAWGRDEQGRVWLAPSREAAIRFAVTDPPGPLGEFFAVRSVRLPALLREVLREGELSSEHGTEKGVRTIRAVPKNAADRSRWRSALLEVEEATHVIRKLVLVRRIGEMEVATVTLTLSETATKDDAFYRAEGYVRPNVRVADGNRDVEVRRFVRRHPALVGLLRTEPAK